MTIGTLGRQAEAAMTIVGELFGDRLGRDAAVRLWDGSGVPSPNGEFTLVVTHPFALRAAFAPPQSLNPGRAFVEGWLDVEGDLDRAIEALENSVAALSPLQRAKIAATLLRLPAPPKMPDQTLRGKVHSKARDAAAIGFHYDLPVAFYQAFLDTRMVYSCAYWDEGVQTLDDAQRAKLDYVLDKVRLRPGDRFLDVGCGWGSLVIRAAQRGANALGITLSRRQHEEAVARIAASGLSDRARVEFCDYRDLREGDFDAAASIGMVEHVGRERLREYFNAVYRALRAGALFLNHGISAQSGDGKGLRAGKDFIGRYVFPDGDLVGIDAMLAAAQAAGFEVRDVENLREHYARTLRAWVENLKLRKTTAVRASDARTERVWRLYMTASARNFRLGRMGLMQSLLAKPSAGRAPRIPPTRRDLYRTAPASAAG